MSSSDPTAPFAGSGGGGERPDDYVPKGPAPDRVVVDGVRVPSCGDGVTVDIRKEGPSHISRHATVQTRYEWNGNVYGELLRPDLQTEYTPARIQLRHPIRDEWVTVMHGFVGAFGGEDSGNVRFEVRDPAQLLEDISASAEFGDAYVEDVLRYVADTYEREQPVYDTVLVSTEAENSQVYDYEPLGRGYEGDEGDSILFGNVLKKSFKANRHNLRDVLEWAQDRAKFRYWFQPTTDDSTIVLRAIDLDDLPSVRRSFSGSEIGGDVDVVTNNALWELSPKRGSHRMVHLIL